MRISQLATEKVLLTLLIEIAKDGVTYVQWGKRYRTQEAHNMAMITNEKLKAVSNILAAILPGICPAQVATGFAKFAADHDPDYGFGENDVIELLAVINSYAKPRCVDEHNKPLEENKRPAQNGPE